MKRFYFIAILITICGLSAMAQDRPDMAHQSTGRDRVGFKLDQPTVTYDEESNEIVVCGAASDYYNVSITSTATQQVIYITTIDGTYDIIDASIMPSGAYVIAFTSQRGNTYKWTFDHGLQSMDIPGGVNHVGRKVNLANDFDLF